MTLHLVEGRYYRTRDGRKVGPLRPGSNGYHRRYSFHAQPADAADVISPAWTASGAYWHDGAANDKDLVAEWTEPAPSPVRQITTTRTEIAPGRYAHVEVNQLQPAEGRAYVHLKGEMFPEELRAAATTLNDLASALDAIAAERKAE